MHKCKNCGSITRSKKVHTQYNKNDDPKTGIVEVYECQSCGYTETIYYAFEGTEGRTADRTFIYRDRRK
jgi:predicted RNA-binding Zn-ribbon protein involved in translation (DUF1610 family)